MNEEFAVHDMPAHDLPSWDVPESPDSGDATAATHEDPAPPARDDALDEPNAPPAFTPAPAATAGTGWSIRESAAAPPSATVEVPDAPPPPDTPAPWQTPPPKHNSTALLALGGGVLFALCAGAALFVIGTVHTATPSIQQPPAIGTLDSISSPALTSTLDSLQQFEKSAGASNVITGVYGSAGRPGMLLMVVKSALLADGGSASGRDAFMHGFSGGLQTTGWTLDSSQSTTTTVDGTTFECAPISSAQLQSVNFSTCVWTENGVAGVVLDMTGQSLPDTLNEAVQARAASEH